MISSQGLKPHHAGLTLVELLIVLSILAVLSTVALRSVVGKFEDGNYDANISQLEEIQRAILGEEEAAGFLGDIGRLPVAIGDSTSTNLEQLAELWDQNASGLPSYAINTPTGDSDVRLGTGWRGPYLNLGINRSELTDGFANPFILYQADGSLADGSDPIAIVQSLGADGGLGGASYNEDFEVVFQADLGAVSAGFANATTNGWQTDLEVTVVRDSGAIAFADGAHLIVRAYGADGSGGLHTVVEEKFTLTIDVPSQTFTLSSLPQGSKVLRAYQDATDPTTKDTGIISPERKSPATHILVKRFTSPVTLTLY
ncbi:MAG: prepilin-type N-terminal cleavage/methylation domain-containing protein [Verrucomicrobiota bacterium]